MQQAFGSSGLGFILEGFQRRVKQLVDDAGNCRFDGLSLRVVQSRQFAVESVQLDSTDVMPMLTQTVNYRASSTVVDFLHERLSLAINNVHRLLHFGLTSLAIAAAGIFQRVDIVQKHVVTLNSFALKY